MYIMPLPLVHVNFFMYTYNTVYSYINLVNLCGLFNATKVSLIRFECIYSLFLNGDYRAKGKHN